MKIQEAGIMFSSITIPGENSKMALKSSLRFPRVKVSI
jgi:hypothetical protein